MENKGPWDQRRCCQKRIVTSSEMLGSGDSQTTGQIVVIEPYKGDMTFRGRGCVPSSLTSVVPQTQGHTHQERGWRGQTKMRLRQSSQKLSRESRPIGQREWKLALKAKDSKFWAGLRSKLSMSLTNLRMETKVSLIQTISPTYARVCMKVKSII